ncbi:8252_t:CDS:2, partial [Racocetra fulgida]
HYNQLVASGFLHQILINSNISKNNRNKQKQQINSSDIDNEIIEKQAHTRYVHKTNVVQTDEQTNKVSIQANPETHEIGEDLKNQLEYAYDYVIEKYKELYYLTPEIKKEYELELKIYLSSILKDLIAEKNQEINAIDQSIENQKGVESQSKWCKECNTTNIDNKKYTWPKCHKKLDTLATLQAESAKELTQLNNIVLHQLQNILQSIRDLYNKQDGLEDE